MHQDYYRNNPLISFKVDDGVPHLDARPSILAEYVLFPMYDIIVKYIPSFITPNQVKLFGILCTVTSSIMMLSSVPNDTVFEPPYADWLPTYEKDIKDSPLGPLHPSLLKPIIPSLSPQTLMFICGLLNAFYCIADNTDGRLARRDKRSSAIGEYLDHSLDCVSSLLSTGVMFCVMGASTSNMAFMISSIAVSTLIVHTYHYETNKFVMGNRIMSVDEAMLLFIFGIWTPMIFPQVSFILIPFPDSVLEAVPSLTGMRLVDVLYIISFLSQIVTVLNLAWQRVMILFRFQTFSILILTGELLACIPRHNAEAVLAAAANTERRFIPYSNYFIGPFCYPVVWVITTAFTYSTLIHIPILAHCAHQPSINYLPMTFVLVTMLIFPSFPVAAMIWSVFAHILQIFCNINTLYAEAKKKASRKSQ